MAAFIAVWFLLLLFRGAAQFLTVNMFWIVPGAQLLILGALLVVNVLFARGVMEDASEQNRVGKKTYFVKPEIWGLATVIGGFFVVTVYWLIHHSVLRKSV